MEQLSLGIIARSRKADERRLAIHPRHLDRIEPELRGRVFLETGYGERFGVSDEQLRPLVGGLRSREQLLADCDVILLPKPLPEDLAEMREGQVLWGWPHCVQDVEITQQAIDRRLTVIAFEAMNHWTADGSFSLHVFHKNNELAGLRLGAARAVTRRVDGGLRPAADARSVIGFGATARGAVTALDAQGVTDVDVLTQPGRRRGRLTDPLGADRAVRSRRGRPEPQRGRDAETAANRWPASSPLTTSSSTACSRTPTAR